MDTSRGFNTSVYHGDNEFNIKFYENISGLKV